MGASPLYWLANSALASPIGPGLDRASANLGFGGFLLVLLHWPKVLDFRAKQVKRETFVLGSNPFVLVASLYCAWLLLGILLPFNP